MSLYQHFLLVGDLQRHFLKMLVQEAQKRWNRVIDFPYREKAIPALPKALGQVFLHKGLEGPVLVLLKALGQIFLHKGMEGLVPTLLNALGQVPSFPYEKSPIPALLEALGQLFLHKEIEGPVPTLLKALRQVSPFPYEKRPVSTLLKALEQGPPIPVLLKALEQVSPKHWDRSLVPLKNFQTSQLFFSPSHHFGLSFLVSLFFASNVFLSPTFSLPLPHP